MSKFKHKSASKVLDWSQPPPPQNISKSKKMFKVPNFLSKKSPTRIQIFFGTFICLDLEICLREGGVGLNLLQNF